MVVGGDLSKPKTFGAVSSGYFALRQETALHRTDTHTHTHTHTHTIIVSMYTILYFYVSVD